jgi:hypothetical protein
MTGTITGTTAGGFGVLSCQADKEMSGTVWLEIA